MSATRTWRVRLTPEARDQALRALADDARPAVKELVRALTHASTERRRNNLGLDWTLLLSESPVTYEVPDGCTSVQIANAATRWAFKRGIKVATRSDKAGKIVVYVLSRPVESAHGT